MLEIATFGTQKDDNLCGNIRKGEVLRFPIGKREICDRTRGCRKNKISYETSSNFYNWQHNKKINFAASPINTARLRENQRREHRNTHSIRDFF